MEHRRRYRHVEDSKMELVQGARSIVHCALCIGYVKNDGTFSQVKGEVRKFF